jgi:hypothetical protein
MTAAAATAGECERRSENKSESDDQFHRKLLVNTVVDTKNLKCETSIPALISWQAQI